MDKTDRQILQLFKENAAQPVVDVARKVNLSDTPCWRRMQCLEKFGIIRHRVAPLDAQKLGVGISVFFNVCVDQYNADLLSQFAMMVSVMPEVVEFYRMTGEVDYMLRVVVADMAAYDALYRKLISNVELTNFNSFLAMEQIKFNTALQLVAEDASGDGNAS